MNGFFIKRGFLIIFLLFCIVFNSVGQNNLQGDTEKNFFDNVRFGGSVGLSFSSNLFNAQLAPKAIYDFNRFFSMGLGVAGSYTNGSNYNAFTLGGSTIGLFRPISVLQLSGEFEENYVSRTLELDGADKKYSYWYPALFLGAGYTTGPITVGLKYDVLFDDHKSIYGSALIPFVSIYF